MCCVASSLHYPPNSRLAGGTHQTCLIPGAPTRLSRLQSQFTLHNTVAVNSSQHIRFSNLNKLAISFMNKNGCDIRLAPLLELHNTDPGSGMPFQFDSFKLELQTWNAFLSLEI